MHDQPPLEITTQFNNESKISASIIWLHGLGADGYDFEPIVHQLLQHSALAHIRFILPHAPQRAVTRNHGYIMPAWYDVYGITSVSQEDEIGITVSAQYINTLIEKEIQSGIPAERILLAGFSQGGAIALHTTLRYPKKLAGVLALSTYLPLHRQFAVQLQQANLNTPIFMAHGVFDAVISLEIAQASRNLLQSCQYLLHWHEYPMAHSLCAEELVDIQHFIQQVLP